MNDEPRQVIWSVPDPAASAPALPPELMATLLQHIATRVAVLDRDLRYTYANAEALKFMGLPAERVIGHHMSEVLDEGVFRSFVPLFERLFAGESLQLKGWVDYRKQGRRYREQALVPYQPGGGPVQAVMVCGWDHTEQRLGEQELAEKRVQLQTSEALKAAIVDNALAALVSSDADGRIVEFNPSAEAMFGRSREQVLGLAMTDALIPERLRAAHEARAQRMQQSGQARGERLEARALRADGSEFPIDMVLWRTDVLGSTFYTASMVDVTERHNAAQQIERQREALRQSEKLAAMGSLLAGVAHELNNPLSIVLGRASLLEERCVDDAVRADALRIREAAERCGRIVRTFLDMARSRPSVRTRVPLNDLVRAAADMLQYSCRSHGIELELALADALPAVQADADQIGQIVLNLLVNAQQALAGTDGERRVRAQTGVEVRREHREPRVWLQVADNGPGVAPALAARIFEPFFTTKSDGSGTGVGLAMARARAREHGGDLVLESTPAGGGASFRLSLPIGGAFEESRLPVTPHQPAATPSARVLVVDDEPELATLMREMLENAGYEVATAESGAVALEMLGMARFDAIVSDLRMPDMDGAALWREISARHPTLARRTLFVTGDTLSAGARDFLKASRCASLDKPFARADLLARVAALLA